MKLEKLYMNKSLTNKPYMKKILYQQKMEEGASTREHVAMFTKAVLDLKNVDVKIEEEDQVVLLLCCLLFSFDNLVDTMMFVRETLTLEEVQAALNAWEIKQKIIDDKCEGTYSNALFAWGRIEKKDQKEK